VLLANVIAVFVSPEYKAWIQSKIGTRQPLEVSSLETPAAEKLNSTLDRLSYGLEALSGTGVITQSGIISKPIAS
jgi:hypothetical protein